MSDPNQAIPGPDPGACDHCGGWRKAGMVHDCGSARDALQAEVENLEHALADHDTERIDLGNERDALQAEVDALAAELRLMNIVRVEREQARAEVERLNRIVAGGPGTPAGRMAWLWEQIHEREDALARWANYSPFESTRTSERALLEAFDALRAEVERLREECGVMHARTSNAIAESNAAKTRIQVLEQALREMVDAVGSACPVHLVANGPIRLVEEEWRHIERRAIEGRSALHPDQQETT